MKHIKFCFCFVIAFSMDLLYLHAEPGDSMNNDVFFAPRRSSSVVAEEKLESVNVEPKGIENFVNESSEREVPVFLSKDDAESKNTLPDKKDTVLETDTSVTEQIPDTKVASETPKDMNVKNSTKMRDQLVNFAIKFVGNPYRAGGTSLENGADCSGFTMSVFKECGVIIPRDSRSQAVGGTEISIADIRPGDLLFYSRGDRINHVALYIGEGKIVHASTEKTGIKIASYNYRPPVKAVKYLD